MLHRLLMVSQLACFQTPFKPQQNRNIPNHSFSFPLCRAICACLLPETSLLLWLTSASGITFCYCGCFHVHTIKNTCPKKFMPKPYPSFSGYSFLDTADLYLRLAAALIKPEHPPIHLTF